MKTYNTYTYTYKYVSIRVGSALCHDVDLGAMQLSPIIDTIKLVYTCTYIYIRTVIQPPIFFSPLSKTYF